MPRGRPSTTGTGHRGERVAVSPATARLLDAARQPGESRPQALARIVAAYMAAHSVTTQEKP